MLIDYNRAIKNRPHRPRQMEKSVQQPVFIISDRSGLTAETMAHTLLSQFPETRFRQTSLPFVDSPEKILQAIEAINAARLETGLRALVFATFVEDSLNVMLAKANAELFDLFDPFIGRIETALGQTSSHQPGQAHGMANAHWYHKRINAVNYALRCDDGLHGKDYDNATMILLGVSRSGKTPTCLYLAMHFGFHAANYPLTEDDFEKEDLPDAIVKNREKVFGLTIDPIRLQQIRSERRPDSRYASFVQCKSDVAAAMRMYTRYNIPHTDSTAYSVEELGSAIKHQMGLESELY